MGDERDRRGSAVRDNEDVQGRRGAARSGRHRKQRDVVQVRRRRDRDGEEYSYRVEYTVGEATHVLFESGAVSTPVMAFALRQNSPNPFNPATTISYYLPSPCNIKLEIFDVAGRRIAVLKEGKAERAITGSNGTASTRAATGSVRASICTA